MFNKSVMQQLLGRNANYHLNYWQVYFVFICPRKLQIILYLQSNLHPTDKKWKVNHITKKHLSNYCFCNAVCVSEKLSLLKHKHEVLSKFKKILLARKEVCTAGPFWQQVGNDS